MKLNFRSMKSKLILLLALLSFVPIGAFAQSVTVKGTVLDGMGETVIGATVVEKVIVPMALLLIWMVSLH